MSSFLDKINEGAVRPFPSVSGLDCWVQCPFKWWLTFVRRIERKEREQSQALLMGRAWDLIQECFFSCGSVNGHGSEWDFLDCFSKAKVSAMSRAFSALFDPAVLGAFGPTPCQTYLTREIGPEGARITVHGHLDRVKSADSFAETKFTGWPSFNSCLLDLRHQLGIYFLLEPAFTEARMEVARTPGLRYKDGDDPSDFEERCYKDIMARPAYYFIGYSKRLGIYGKSFFRSEIALDLLEDRILSQCREVEMVLELAGKHPARRPGPFAQKTRNCVMGKSPCEYMDICKRRVSLHGDLMVNEEIYDIGKAVD